jgi:hypothetical protein
MLEPSEPNSGSCLEIESSGRATADHVGTSAADVLAP